VNVYYPSVAKNDYSKTQLFGVIKNYFDNSLPSMVSLTFIMYVGVLEKVLDKLL